MPRAVSWISIFCFPASAGSSRVSVGGRRRVHAGRPWIPGVVPRSGAWPDTRNKAALGCAPGPPSGTAIPRLGSPNPTS